MDNEQLDKQLELQQAARKVVDELMPAMVAGVYGAVLKALYTREGIDTDVPDQLMGKKQ